MVGTGRRREGLRAPRPTSGSPGRRGCISTEDLPDMGTARYMAPEQARNLFSAAKKGQRAGLDHRVDIYAFGVVIYELITGQHIFIDDDNPPTFEETLAGHLLARPTPVHMLVLDCPEACGPSSSTASNRSRRRFRVLRRRAARHAGAHPRLRAADAPARQARRSGAGKARAPSGVRGVAFRPRGGASRAGSSRARAAQRRRAASFLARRCSGRTARRRPRRLMRRARTDRPVGDTNGGRGERD